MTTVQPTLDGTIPTPAPAADYQTWAEQVRPAFVEAARTGERFTSYEIARDHDLPEPANPKAAWGHFIQTLRRDGVIEQCGWDESVRPGGGHSGVKVWRGTRAAQAGRAA